MFEPLFVKFIIFDLIDWIQKVDSAFVILALKPNFEFL